MEVNNIRNIIGRTESTAKRGRYTVESALTYVKPLPYNKAVLVRCVADTNNHVASCNELVLLEQGLGVVNEIIVTYGNAKEVVFAASFGSVFYVYIGNRLVCQLAINSSVSHYGIVCENNMCYVQIHQLRFPCMDVEKGTIKAIYSMYMAASPISPIINLVTAFRLVSEAPPDKSTITFDLQMEGTCSVPIGYLTGHNTGNGVYTWWALVNNSQMFICECPSEIEGKVHVAYVNGVLACISQEALTVVWPYALPEGFLIRQLFTL
jgi:hypothetical protein